MKTNKEVTIYTDGACSGNPGPGGWACILCCLGKEKVMSGFEAQTTNNRKELMAAIRGLEALKWPCDVELYSDSSYLVDAMTKGWAKKWKERGWIKPDRSPAKNPELFDRLLTLCEEHNVRFIWVKGHASNEYNNRCDELAVGEIAKNR